MITVTCDCGREMRVARHLMGSHVKCVECGAAIQLPGDPAAGVGPPCPHCGRPWPVGESRCPSCMARTRTRSRREEEAAARRGGFSKRFGDITADIDAPGPEYEPPPTMDSATVRVKHWYDQPTTIGWSVAAGVAALAAVIVLIHGMYIEGGVWIATGTGLLLVALGLQRGNATARSITLAAPILVVVVGSALAVWLAPEALAWTEMVVLTIIVAAMTAGLSLLTHRHGTVGVVTLGGVLAVVGLIGTCIAMGTTEWYRVVTGQVAQGVREGLSVVGDTLTTTRPAPETVVDADTPPADPPPPVRIEFINDPPVVPPPQPTTAPVPPPVDWSAAMAIAGFRVRFGDPGEVQTARQTVTIDGVGRCVEIAIESCTAVLDTAATIYEDVPAADPDQAELIAAAHHVTDNVGGAIEYEMWRNDRGPRVYYVRTNLDRDGETWVSRIESRRVGRHVLVLSSVLPKANRAAQTRSWAFFKSFRHIAPDGVGE